MRLDRLLSDCGIASRRDAAKAAKRGALLVDGVAVRDASTHVDPATAKIVFCGREVKYARYTYLMLNKPEGYVSATDDGNLPVVTELVSEEYRRQGLFPVGRLDRDTVGLMILTNNGPLAHRVLSPKHHVEKIYSFRTDAPLPKDAEERFAGNVTLADGTVCKSAVYVPDPDRMGGKLTLTEGKYHEIKRMVASLGAHVVYLSREVFAGIPLDPALAPGEYRPLTAEEQEKLESNLPHTED